MYLVRSRSFLSTILGCYLVFLLAACGSGGSNTSATPPTTGNTPTSNASVTSGTTQPGNGVTTAPVPPTLTSCPATGTARAAIMPPLALGNHQNIVYIVNEFQAQAPTFGTLKRLDVTTGAKTEVVKIADISISDAQISADGQWILFVSVTANQAKLQLVRVDGQALQTLYCATPSSNGANPSSALSNIEWSANQQLTVFNSYTGAASYLYLLNMPNGTLQTEISTVSGVIDTPLTWLDNTRLYANGQTQSLLFGSLSGGTSTTFASISDGTQLSIVGWTTMCNTDFTIKPNPCYALKN